MEIINEIIIGTMNTISEIINSASKIGINTIIPLICINIIAIFYIFSFVYADRKIKELDKKEFENKATKTLILFFVFLTTRYLPKKKSISQQPG